MEYRGNPLSSRAPQTSPATGKQRRRPTPPGGGGSALAAMSGPSIRPGVLRRGRRDRIDRPLVVRAAAPYHAADIELAFDPSELRAIRVRRLAAARGAMLSANVPSP